MKKYLQRGLTLLLAVLMFCSTVPAPVAAAFAKEVKDTVWGTQYTLQNDFIKVTVNSATGRFGIRTVEGQPQRKNDQNTNLTFQGIRGDDPDTSFTTFRIDGTDYIFGNAYDFTTESGKHIVSRMGRTVVVNHDEYETVPDGCQAVITEWSIGEPTGDVGGGTLKGVEITQILLLYPETDKANSGNVEIFYNIENNSGAEVEVGARILLDTMVGANDGPEFQIGTISGNTLKVERMLSKNPTSDQGIALENRNYWTLPSYWVMKDTLDPTNPLATNVIGYGYTGVAGLRELDYMIVSHWNKLANEKFEVFDDYVAVPAEQTEAAAAYAEAKRAADLAVALAEQKEAEAALKEEAAEGQDEGTKAKLDAEKARADATTVRNVADQLVSNANTAKATLESIARKQKGSSVINPNLDFTTDTNDYGTADSAVAFYWSGEGDDAKIANGETMNLGTIYGLGEIIDPTSVLAITFPNPITQVEIDPANQDKYKNDGVFDIEVEIENLSQYGLKHDSIDVTMTLENNLRFVKRDAAGNILRDENGVPVTSYSKTQTVTFEKAITPEQAAAGERNPILPGEKVGVTFTVMAVGKPWPTTRQYMVTATSAALAAEFETVYGTSAGDEVKALYNASRANFIFLPAVGTGTPSYSTSVSPEECFTTDPKYITVNLTNIEAYNPGSSVRGQEAAPNFNLYFKEVVTGKRYQVDVLDNVQCVVTDDGLTGDMRISYTNGTLVDDSGIVLQLNLGSELPVGEYRVEIDYISTDEDENAMLDVVTQQTFLVTENEEARVREPAILAVVRETVDFDDSELMQMINDLVAEVTAAIDELQAIAEKLESTDWSEAVYDEITDFVKELASPVLSIYDDIEKLTDFSNIVSEMQALSNTYDELADVDFSSLKNFDLGKAISGVNVDVSLSDTLKKRFEKLLVGPLGFEDFDDITNAVSSVTDAVGGDGDILDSILSYANNVINPITDIYTQLSNLVDTANSNELNGAIESALGATTGTAKEALLNKIKELYDIESLVLGPFAGLIGDDTTSGNSSDKSFTDTVYDWLESYVKKFISPITSIYDDIEDLLDFTNIQSDIEALLKDYGVAESDIADMTAAIQKALLSLDFGKIISGTNVSVSVTDSVTDKFKELYNIETLLKGPFASGKNADGTDKSIADSIYEWLEDYVKKFISPITSIYDEIEDLLDFSEIGTLLQKLSDNYDGLDLSTDDITALANSLSDINWADFITIEGVTIGENDDLSDLLVAQFKKLYDVESLLKGPFGGSGDKSITDTICDWLEDYVKKMFSPILSIYDDIEDLTDFSTIVKDMEELAAIYPELEGVDFSSLTNFDFDTLIDGVNVEITGGVAGKFKEIYDVATLVAGFFSDDSTSTKSFSDTVYEWIEGYAKKMVSPITSLYDDIEDLVDFSNIVTEMEELAKLYPELEGIDFSAIADFDWGKAFSDTVDSVTVNVSLSENFKKVFDYEAILKGPFSSDDPNKSAMDVFLDRLKAYGLKTINPILSIYDDIADLADFSSIQADMDRLSKNFEVLENADFSCLEDFDVTGAIKDLWNATSVNVGLSDAFKQKFQYDTIIKGPFDATDDFTEDALTAWLTAIVNAYQEGEKIYQLGVDAYKKGATAVSNQDLQAGVQVLADIYKDIFAPNVDWNISVDWNNAISKANSHAAKTAYTQGEKVVLALMAMYAKMQDIYSGLEAKYARAKEIYNQVVGIKDTVVTLVKKISNGDFSALIGLGTDMLRFVLGEWLNPVEDAINSGKELYEIAKTAYTGGMTVEDGAKLLITFYEKYLDVDVKADFSSFESLKSVAADTYSDAQKMALVFTAMYAKMRNIYSGLEQKYDRAKEIYAEAEKIVNMVISVGSNLLKGDFTQLLGIGEDLLGQVLNVFLDPIMDAKNSAIDLYEIAKQAYEGKVSVKDGAQNLINYFETYLGISVTVDASVLSGAKTVAADTAKQAEKAALAFMAMYAKLQDIYSGISDKIDRATDVYNEVKGMIDTVMDLVGYVTDGNWSALGSQVLSSLTDVAKDIVPVILDAFLSPVMDAKNSVMEIYDLAKQAYNQAQNGSIDVATLKMGAKKLTDFLDTYLGVKIKIDMSVLNIVKKDAEGVIDKGQQAALIFMAMYENMSDIYESVEKKYNRAKEIYDEVMDLVDTFKTLVSLVASGEWSALGTALLSKAKELVPILLDTFLSPAKDAVNSVEELYDIAKQAASGNLNTTQLKSGVKKLVAFFETYLDVKIDIDTSVLADVNNLKKNGSVAIDDAQKTALAFLVMYEKLDDIYTAVSKKVDRAKDVYDDVRSLVDTVEMLVKKLTSGNIGENIVDLISTYGMDLVKTILNAWLSPVMDAIDSVKELYSIAQQAYQGKISMAQGANLLMDFFETYLGVDFSSVSATDKAAIKSAFETMYGQMKSIYGSVRQLIDTATGAYDTIMGFVDTIKSLASGLSDPMALVNNLLDMGKDTIFGILQAYMDEIKDLYNSVMEIYEIGKRAYEGKMDIKEGAELLIGFYEKYLNVSISIDMDAVGKENVQAAAAAVDQGKQMALAFMAMYARMKNIYSGLSGKIDELKGIYDEMMELVDSVIKLFTDPASGAYALMDMVKARIMKKLDGMGIYKDMFMQVVDIIEEFASDPSSVVNQALDFVQTSVLGAARVKADQALYSELYGLMVTAATALDPKSDYEFDPSDLKTSLPTYTLKAFADQAEYDAYVKEMEEQNKKKKEAAKKSTTDTAKAAKKAAEVGNDGVMVKITGMIRQIGEGENVTDFIVDTSAEPAIINDTVAFQGSDIVFTQGKLKIGIGGYDIDAGKYISEAQKLYGSETPLFDTLIVSGTGQLYIESSGFIFHDGEWSLDFYNGFEKILDPETETEKKDDTKSQPAESDALNETAAWAIGALNDLANPFAALTIKDVYFNRHTLFSAPSFSVAGFGLTFDNYLLRSSEVCFGGHIDFKIVKGEIQNVFFNNGGLRSIEADLKFDLGGDLGLIEKGETAGGDLVIHYYDPDYRASFAARGYPTPEEKYSLTFNAQLKSVGGIGVQLSFKRVADGRILPDVIGFQATPPAPGILVTGGTYLTQLRGAIKELADTIAGGSSSVPLTIEAGVDIKFGVEPATFEGKIDMILKMTGIEFNGSLKYKGKPMITQAQIKAQWVTPWFVSASMEMDVMGWGVIIGKARLFLGQNLEKDRIDFEGFVSAALQIPKKVPVVGGFELGQVSFGLNNDKIWGSASVGVKPVFVSVGITYYWGGDIEFGTSGEGLPEAYTYLLMESPEEEPVLVAIGTGMQTEATSWVNENTLHEIEYHAIGDGISLLDNGQNDIGIGGIEVQNEGKTHIIPVGDVASDRDALIEIEYYGDEKSPQELEQMLNLKHGDPADNGEAYAVKIGKISSMAANDTAFKQEMETEDGVNRHLVYVMVPHSVISSTKHFTLVSSEKVATKLLSTPTASSLNGVIMTPDNNNAMFTAKVQVDNAHDGDTVDLYLTREQVRETVEYVTTVDEDGNEVQIPITEDTDPGILIYEGLPVTGTADANHVTTLTQLVNLSNLSGDNATVNGDIRELMESGDYYLRAVLKSDTAYDAQTSGSKIRITDPKAPGAADHVTLTPAGNGYFDLSFTAADAQNGNSVTAYRVDFYSADGNIYPNYNGMIFDAADLANGYYDSNTNKYSVRLGGWTVTGGEGTAEDPWTYTGLETGNSYIAKVYAVSQTADENYHYSVSADSAATPLPKVERALVDSVTYDGKEVEKEPVEMSDLLGGTMKVMTRTLVTNEAEPTVTVTTNTADVTLEAYVGDEKVSSTVSTSNGTLPLQLTGLKTDGDYTVELHMTNNVTQDLSVDVLYVTVDTVAPTIMVTSPRSVAATRSMIEYDENGEAARVAETTDVIRGVDFSKAVTVTGITSPGSTLQIAGQKAVVKKDGSFSGLVTLNSSLPSGEIKLQATDKAGNTSTAVVTVTNSGYAAPVGLNAVRMEMKPGTTQTVPVYLRYADGKDASGTQQYRSVSVPTKDRDKLSYSVDVGDAVTVDENGVLTAVHEGAAIVTVKYAVNKGDESLAEYSGLTLSSTVAVIVSEDASSDIIGAGEDNDEPGDNNGGDSSGAGGSAGGGAGGGAGDSADTKVDVVVNGRSDTVLVDEDGTAVVQITKVDLSSDGTVQVSIMSDKPSGYELSIDAETAKTIRADGTDVSFTGGNVSIQLPGETLTGSDTTITVEEMDAAAAVQSRQIATALSSQIVCAGTTIELTGVEIAPGDRVPVTLEIPAGANVEDITAIILIDEDGNYTSVPWKLTVAGNVAYVKCFLPESGTLVPVSHKTSFTDVSADYWGAEAIRKATEQMILFGYNDGTFAPEQNVTRAEFVTLMLRGAGLMTADESIIDYNDVNGSDWYYRAISIASDLGIVKGYEGFARPNDSITRIEGMAIASRLLRLLALFEELSDSEVEEILSSFYDWNSIPEWGRADAATCVKNGIILGMGDGSIAPGAEMSRVQAAVIATRLSAAITNTL